MEKVDVIILNYRTKELTVQAVQSLLSEPALHEVLVVENGSGDESREFLQKAFHNHSQVRLLITEKNLGFGGGNNWAVKKATAPYLFFLNSDAFLFAPGSLQILISELKSDPRLGLVAPAVYLTDKKSLQIDAQGRFPTLATLLLRRNHSNAINPDWISGVAFMARREEFLKVGGFDPSLFMYYEDVDLCRRYKAAGYYIKRNLQAAVVHLGGASKQSKKIQKQTYFQSQDRYLELAGSLPITRLLVRIARRPYILFARLFLWK